MTPQPISTEAWKRWYAEEYLRSPEWLERRASVLERCRGICEGCRSARATQVHHTAEAYAQLRNAGQELLSDLVALCDDCHDRVAHWDKWAAKHRPATAPRPVDPRTIDRIITEKKPMGRQALVDALRPVIQAMGPGLERAAAISTAAVALNVSYDEAATDLGRAA